VSPSTDRFLRALRREPVDRTPVWFMRQAGRYLPEYRSVRGDGDILATCRDPDRVVELTLQPLRRMPLDAAIVFSDIMVPLAAVGIGVRIEAGVGPVIDHPVRDAGDVARIRPLAPEVDVPFVATAIRHLRQELGVPLIGFAGAPFTLACYLVEGGPSRDQVRTRALMAARPEVWSSLMDALTQIVTAHLLAQIKAGVQAVQVFDSWVGVLAPDRYRRAVRPWTERIFEAVAATGTPAIHFGVGTGELLRDMRVPGVACIGIDHRTPLDAGWERVGADVAVQGNLDPVALLGPWEDVREEAGEVLRRAAGRDGHVFNLGHGVLPDTPVEHLERLVELVHTETERVGAG
jgi:uroporphyrinogen decarboxylase